MRTMSYSQATMQEYEVRGVTQLPHRYLSTPEEIIDEARNGRMFILVDDEDRENEGDLVIPSRPRTDLSRYDQGTDRYAGTAAHESQERHPARDCVHCLDRSARGGHDGHLSR